MLALFVSSSSVQYGGVAMEPPCEFYFVMLPPPPFLSALGHLELNVRQFQVAKNALGVRTFVI